MSERPHDQGPEDASARDSGPVQDAAFNSAGDADRTDAGTVGQRASDVPYTLWPRAAGSGAGAVAVPIDAEAEQASHCQELLDAIAVVPDALAKPTANVVAPSEIAPPIAAAEPVEGAAQPADDDRTDVAPPTAPDFGGGDEGAASVVDLAEEATTERSVSAAARAAADVGPEAAQHPAEATPEAGVEGALAGSEETASLPTATLGAPQRSIDAGAPEFAALERDPPSPPVPNMGAASAAQPADTQPAYAPEPTHDDAASPSAELPPSPRISTIEPSNPAKPAFSALTTPVFEPRPSERAPQQPPAEPAIAPIEPIWSRPEHAIADRFDDVASRPAAYIPSSPPPAVPEEVQRPATDASRYLRPALRVAAAVALSLVGLFLVLVILYRWVNPPLSTLMLAQRITGTTITQRWVPLERMSPYLPLAAIMSEDARFCFHGGVDWGELEDALDRVRDGVPRGGSTISMQVVKNLFLWPSKSYLRKAIEIPLTFVIESAWPKRRILEIYLNIAEWGPGVFGAEAASRYHFRKPAALLNPREAALLAVSLPNPFERVAGSPGPGTNRLADNLLVRMRAAQRNAACARNR